MKIKYIIGLLFSYVLVAGLGFAGGIYALPILTAPKAPDVNEINAISANASYTTEFKKDLKGSDFLHQAEGPVTLGNDFISFVGSISPGPDYKLYLSPEFVETEDDFKRLKHTMLSVGVVKTFNNFMVPIDSSINLSDFNTVIVWCESFEQFITAAQYR